MHHPSTRMAALATFLSLTSRDDTSFARAFSIPAIIQAGNARTRKSAPSSTQASLYIERGGEENYHFLRSSQNTNMTATTTWPSLLSSSQAVLEPEPPSPVAMNDAVMEFLVEDKLVLDEADAVLEMGAVDQEEAVIHYDDFQGISSSVSIHASSTPSILSDTEIPTADSPLSPTNSNMGGGTIPTKPFVPIKGQESTTSNQNAVKKGPKVPKWKKSSSTAFRTTSYLDSLSTNTIKPKTDDAYPNEISSTSSSSSLTDPTTRDDTDKSLLKDLRNQEAQFRQSRREKFQKAVYEATRRTNPQEAIQNRIEQGEKMRKEKERKQLEKLYQERTERLERKKSLEKDRKDILERFQAERERMDNLKMQQDVTSIDASDDDGTDGGLGSSVDFDDDNDTSDD